jgi:uncharacterized caspase-like protein/exonuclease VII small subunit
MVRFFAVLVRPLVWFALAVLMATASAAAPAPEKRVALVIGIDDYPEIGPLHNPVRDAQAIEATLKGLGFKVVLETDRTKRRLIAALDGFVEDYKGAELVLVFFAGHGVQIGGRNFLLTTDTTAGSAAELESSSLSLDEVFTRIAKVSARRIVLLDACRNDPTQAVIADPDHPIAPGLGRIGSADGSLYAFATAPGVTASDGTGDHSPFTAAVLAHFDKAGLELRSLLTLVRMEVYERSRGQQLPYVEDALPGTVFFDAKGEPLTERDRLLLAMAGIDNETRAQVESVAAQYDVPLAPLYGALVAAQLTLTQVDFATRLKVLNQAAEEFIKLRNDLNTLASSDPSVGQLRAQAERDLSNGNFESARAALTQAIEIDRNSGEQLETRLRERNLSEAASRSIRAGIARSHLEYRTAAADLSAAADLAERWDKPVAWTYRKNQAELLQLQGDEFGEKAALTDALDVNRRALALAPRADRPDDWALTQHQSGNILEVLGSRDNSAPRFEEALEAYRQALEVRTRDHAPLLWASTQNNIGIALWMLGLIENDTARLEQALAAFQQALLERARDKGGVEWAQTQSNLGVVLRALGERETGTARLEQAIAAYRQALQERTRARVPLEWAQTQNNLGNALVALGERADDVARFEQAVAAFRRALLERTRERVPLDWAATQYNLGVALSSLGERESGSAHLEEAVAAYRLALQERTRASEPLNWAVTQSNLADALRLIGERETGAERLTESISTYRDALLVLTRERSPQPWAETENGLGISLRLLGERESGTDRLEEAIAAFRAALLVRTREREPSDWAHSMLSWAIAEKAVAGRSSADERTRRLTKARQLAADALAAYQENGTPRELAAAQKVVADIAGEMAGGSP